MRVIQGGRELPTNRTNAVYDCVDDEIFGIPPKDRKFYRVGEVWGT